MKKCFRLKDMLSFKFLVNINMHQQHYLGNMKPTFPVCDPEQVYATILHSSKNNIFQNCQDYSRRILEISLT